MPLAYRKKFEYLPEPNSDNRPKSPDLFDHRCAIQDDTTGCKGIENPDEPL